MNLLFINVKRRKKKDKVGIIVARFSGNRGAGYSPIAFYRWTGFENSL